jgi:hypothetical protein
LRGSSGAVCLPRSREDEEDEIDQPHDDHGRDIGPVGAQAGHQAQQEDTQKRAEGHAGDLEGKPQDLVEEGKSPGQSRQHEPESHDGGARHPEVVAIAPAGHQKRPVDIGDEGGGERAQRRVDRRQNDGGQHDAPQDLRHGRADEEGEDLVRPRENSRMLGVVGEEPGADREIEQERHEGADRRERQRALALAARLDGEQALHEVVVGTEGGHRADEAVEDREPEDVGVGQHPLQEIGRARRWAPVDHAQAPRFGRRPQHGAQATVDPPGEEPDRQRAADKEHRRLEDIGPDDSLDPAERDVGDRHHGEERDRRPERPAHEQRDRQRRRHEPDARAQEARDEEEDRARDLARLAEAIEQELVDRRAVVAVEGGDEEIGDGELGQARAHEELPVLPVLAVRRGRHRDDGDGADLGREEGEARGPPGDAAARKEEIGGPALLAAEGAADDHEKGQ